MKLIEFYAKEIFQRSGIPSPNERLVHSVSEGLSVIPEIGIPCVLKAQVLVGSRGKFGGVRFVEKEEELLTSLKEIFSLKIKENPVEMVLISEKVRIKKELFLSITIDRNLSQPVLLASPYGGMDIEEIARERPKSMLKEPIDPFLGLLPYQSRRVAFFLLPNEPNLNPPLSSIIMALSKVFFENDCLLTEINPLVVSEEGNLLALDAKIILDDNARFRHPDWDKYEYNLSPLESIAKAEGLSYIKLSGEIGTIVNGAGLAMATLDLLNTYGARSANFLDIGGSSSPEKTKKALEIITSSEVKVVLINIFGGITRCDDVAKGLIDFLKEKPLSIPFVVRLVGTNEEKARSLLSSLPSNFKIHFAQTMKEAVKKASELARSL